MIVNQMMTLSYLFFGLMIFFLTAAVFFFFLFDVRKAWRILGRKGVSPHREKKLRKKQEKKQEILLDITYIHTEIRL